VMAVLLHKFWTASIVDHFTAYTLQETAGPVFSFCEYIFKK
jgi:hypothetical protein